MGAKRVWVTWMPTGEGAPSPDPILNGLGNLGLQIGGAPWIDDLEKMAWFDLGTELREPAKANLWLIAGTGEDFRSARNRYGLSLAISMVREGRGGDFPIVCLGLDKPLDASAMPTLLGNLKMFSRTDPGSAAKIAMLFSKRPDPVSMDFRISATGHPFIGQWFEVGPRAGEWQGAMFGVSGEGKITHQLVGSKGQIPERSTLEYATEGIKAEVGGVEYTAWAVQNRIGPEDSYYVKVDGHPAKLMFGGHPGTDQAEVTVLDLK